MLLSDCDVEVKPHFPDVTMITNARTKFGTTKVGQSEQIEKFDCREGFLLVEQGQRVHIDVRDTKGGLMVNGGTVTVEKRREESQTIVGVSPNPSTSAFVSSKSSTCVIS